MTGKVGEMATDNPALPQWPMPEFMYDPAGLDVIRSSSVKRPTLFLPPKEYDELVASARLPASGKQE